MPDIAAYLSTLPPSTTKLRVQGVVQLSGTLPESIFPAQLETLDLRGSHVSGSIPKALFLRHDLSLQSIQLDGSPISGTVPTELGAFHTHHHNTQQQRMLHNGEDDEDDDVLEGLSLSFQSMFLSGTIPTQLGNMVSLGGLSMMDQRISGTLPTELGSSSVQQTLSLLAIAETRISGSMPSEFGQLGQLQHFQLFGNSLSGALPSSLRNLRLADDHPDSCLLVFQQVLAFLEADGATCEDELRSEWCSRGDSNRFTCSPQPVFGVGHSARCSRNLTCVESPPRPPSVPSPSLPPRGASDAPDAEMHARFDKLAGIDVPSSSPFVPLLVLMLVTIGICVSFVLTQHILPWRRRWQAQRHARQIDEMTAPADLDVEASAERHEDQDQDEEHQQELPRM